MYKTTGDQVTYCIRLTQPMAHPNPHMPCSLLQLIPSYPCRAHSEKRGDQTPLFYVFMLWVMFTLVLNEGLGIQGLFYLRLHRNGLQ